jgi:hypothetical protein
MKTKRLVAGEPVSRILIMTGQTLNLFGINAKIDVHNIGGRFFVMQG